MSYARAGVVLKGCTSTCVEVVCVELRGSRTDLKSTMFLYDADKTQQLYSFGLLLICSILFTQVPMPSRLTSTTSPSLSHNCGSLPMPTP